MDSKMSQTVKTLEDKTSSLEKRLGEIVTLTQGLQGIIADTSKQTFNALENKYEDQQKQILDNLQEFQALQSNHVNDVTNNHASLLEKHSARLETIENDIEDLFRNLETVHMKQNCGVAGALLSVSLYLMTLTLGAQVFYQQVTK